MHRQHFVLLLTFPLLIMSLSILGFSSRSDSSMSAVFVGQPPQDQAQQAINGAQTAINIAYTNLAFADTVGSPIVDLIGTLNAAIVELNLARQAYIQTDYSTAITLAVNAQTTANTVSDEAQLRGVTTVAQTQAQIMLVIAVIVISIPLSYFVVTRWQQYRREKRREFLQMEIRLPDEEEEDEKP